MKKYSFFSGVILALIAFACLAPIYNPPTGGGSESDPVFLAAKDTDGTLAANSDSKWATQKATKTALDAKGPPPSDTAYDATSWDGVTTVAPSKNAVRDEMEGKQTAAQVQALIDAAVAGLPVTNSGVYTPVTSAEDNLGTPNIPDAQWMRVGNTVTVAGMIEVVITLPATSTSFRMSIPVASPGMSNNYEAGGTAISRNLSSQAETVSVSGRAGGEIVFEWFSVSTGAQKLFYTFTYQVIP